MSFHAGLAKKTPTRSSSDSLKRKSGDLEDAENRSPNIKEGNNEDLSSTVKKTRVTRSAGGSSGTASGLQQPKRSSKLAPPTTRSSKSTGKAGVEPKRRIAATEKSSNERLVVKTPSKNYDRTSLLSPSRINSSAQKVASQSPPSSVLKFPKQCLSEKIKGFFDKAPIKSEEEINELINPKLKPKTKWVDFREKAKRQTEVIGDLKGVLRETLMEYRQVQASCVGAERSMEEQYQSMRNTLKEQLKVNLELKTNEAQLQSEFAKIFTEHASQGAELAELKTVREELSRMNQELTKMVSDLADKLKAESDTRTEVEALLDATKRDLEAAAEETASLKHLSEQKLESATSEFKEELQALRADVERKQAELERHSAEKEQTSQKATDARETFLKSQADLREKEIAAQRFQQDSERAGAEVEQLKAQLAQKDTDLRNTLASMQENQRVAAEEKAALRAEISSLQPRVFQLEEQRLANNSELAAKKEELLSATREAAHLTKTVQKLQASLSQREKEADEGKIAVIHLGVERELRLKSELREDNERAERICACAQLAATQRECDYRVREIESTAQGQAAQLGEEVRAVLTLKTAVDDENKLLLEQIAGCEGELAELQRALQHAEANHEAVAELSKVKGEVEMYKRRVTELEKTKTHEGQNATIRIAELEEELVKRDIQRRKLHNLVQELRGNVRVFARVRPYLPSDGDAATLESPINTRSDSSGLKITRLLKGPEDRPESHGFTFDKVFNPSTSQENVFEEVSEFVQSALDGYNVCLFSYGQTGSGKTHTMQGSGDGAMRGIIPRAIQQVGLYKLQLEEKGWEYSMEVSFIEIYNETIRDLLRVNGSTELKHEIKKDANGKIFVSDVTMSALDPNNKEQLNAVMELAARHRSVAHTAMNAESSRSHSIFALHLKARHAEDNVVLRGTLSLVDLAGSERLDRSEATGSRMKETMAINKSLSSLTDVFTAIANKQAHIPFRNSKLTHLLQPALSGDGKALMMVNLSPTEESYYESLCSLRFASQVNQCELGKPRKQVKEVGSCPSSASSSSSSQGAGATATLPAAKSSTGATLTRGASTVSSASRPAKMLKK